MHVREDLISIGGDGSFFCMNFRSERGLYFPNWKVTPFVPHNSAAYFFSISPEAVFILLYLSQIQAQEVLFSS